MTKNNSTRITNAILLAKLEERVDSVKEHIDLKIQPIQRQLDVLNHAFESHKENSFNRYNNQEEKISVMRTKVKANDVKIISITKKSILTGASAGGILIIIMEVVKRYVM